MCPLEFSENEKRLRQVADEIATGVGATVEVVDDDELVLRTLSFDEPVEVIPFSDAPDSADSD